jgi:hypothetical protein
MAAETVYRLEPGPHVLANLATLMGHAAGMPPGVEAGPLGAGYRLLVWLALTAGSVMLLRRGQPLAGLGLAWFALGIAPVIALSGHGMDPYYLDLALIGLALTVGALVGAASHRAAPRRLAGVLGAALLVAYLMVGATAVRAELPRSQLAAKAARAETALADVRAAYPSLPRGATLYLIDSDDFTYWATGWGALFRVAYHDPALRVLFASRGDPLPPAGERGASFFAFAVADGRLLDRTTSLRR